MSARNWRECPKCQQVRDNDRIARIDKINETYGVVPPNEFAAAWLGVVAEVAPAPEDTLSEDYQIGIRNGVFQIEYRAFCTRCGFSFSYDYADRVVLAGGQIEQNDHHTD